jgi:hypothetical protein
VRTDYPRAVDQTGQYAQFVINSGKQPGDIAFNTYIYLQGNAPATCRLDIRFHGKGFIPRRIVGDTNVVPGSGAKPGSCGANASAASRNYGDWFHDVRLLIKYSSYIQTDPEKSQWV